jgi:hypothetical protein
LGICRRPPESSDCGGGRRCGSRVTSLSAESDSTEHGRGLQLNLSLQAVAGKRLVDVGLNPRGRASQPLATPAAGPIAVGEKPTQGRSILAKLIILVKLIISRFLLTTISWCIFLAISNNRFGQNLLIFTNFSTRKIFCHAYSRPRYQQTF